MALDGIHNLISTAPRPLLSPLVCFSDTAWMAAQGSRRLMSRFARQRDVFFLEPPACSDVATLRIRPCPETGVQVATPLLPDPSDAAARRAALDLLLARSGPAVAWYAAAGARAFSDHVPWLVIAYDGRAAPSAEAAPLEAGLLRDADLVFRAEHFEAAARRAILGPDPFGLAAAQDLLCWDAIPEQMAALLRSAERNASPAIPPATGAGFCHAAPLTAGRVAEPV